MVAYGIPPKKLVYGIHKDTAIREILKVHKYGNREFLVIDNTRGGIVERCITVQKLLDLSRKEVYQLKWDDMKNVEKVYRNKLTRDRILGVTSRGRSLFVLKDGTKKGRILNTFEFRDVDSEITEELALIMLRREKQPNYPKPGYPNLIEYMLEA